MASTGSLDIIEEDDFVSFTQEWESGFIDPVFLETFYQNNGQLLIKGTTNEVGSITQTILSNTNANVTQPTLTTAAFTPANNSLLVVMAPAWIPGVRTVPQSITDSVGLTWNQEIFREDTPNGNDPGAFATTVAIWSAKVETGTSMTVTVDFGQSTQVDSGNNGTQSIYIVQYTGSNPYIKQTYNHGTNTPFGPSPFTGNFTNPTEDGSYTLAVAVSDNTPTESWDIFVGNSPWVEIDNYHLNYTVDQAQYRPSNGSDAIEYQNIEAYYSSSIGAVEVAVGPAQGILEEDDTLVADGTSEVPGIYGELNVTEEDDTLVAISTLYLKGSLTATEADDTLSATSQLYIKGVASNTEADDTLTSIGTFSIKGDLDVIEEDDTLDARGGNFITGELNITEEDDFAVATGALYIKGAVVVIEEDDTLASTSTLYLKGSLTVTEEDDTLISSGTLGINGVLSITEEDDTLSSSSKHSIRGTLSSIEDDDALVATGLIVLPNHGVLNVIEEDDTLVATGKFIGKYIVLPMPGIPLIKAKGTPTRTIIAKNDIGIIKAGSTWQF